MDDIGRLIEFIFRNARQITNITCSLDSHLPYQIIHPGWWVDPDGNHPAPYTVISYAAIQASQWIPVSEPRKSIRYVQQLEAMAKKQLII